MARQCGDYSPGKINLRLLQSVSKWPAPEKPKEILDSTQMLVLRHQHTGALNLYALTGRKQRKKLAKVSKILAGNPTFQRALKLAKEARSEAAEETAEKRVPMLTLETFINEHYGPWLVDVVKSDTGELLPRKRSGQSTWDRLRTLFLSDPKLARARLDEMGRHIEPWKRKRAKQVRPATVVRDIGTLRAALNRAVRWENVTGLKSNPLSGVEMPEVARTSVVTRALTEAERRRLREALERRDEKLAEKRDSFNEWRKRRNVEPLESRRGLMSQLTVAVITAMESGLRRNEQFSLTWGDVDLRRGRLRVRAEVAKTNEERSVPMSQTLRQTLREWHLEQGRPRSNADIFTSRNGTQLGNLKRSFQAVLKDARIPRIDKDGKRVSWRSLRNTFATRVGRHADRDALRLLMGHAEGSKVTDRYISVEADRLEQAIQSTLDQVIS